jgi:hypothetical protein
MFIVRLLAAASVTDGITFANRASPQHDLLAVARPIGFEPVQRGGKWINKSSFLGALPGVDPPRSEPEAEPLLLKRKIPTGCIRRIFRR